MENRGRSWLDVGFDKERQPFLWDLCAGLTPSFQLTDKQQFEKDPVLQDPSKRHLVTSMWSDKLIKRPENHMTGVSFVRGGYSRIRRRVPRGSAGYRIYRPEHWIFEGTKLEYGDELGANVSIVGCERKRTVNQPRISFRSFVL